MTRIWSVQEAKAHFSELLRQAETEPQLITRHGKVVAEVVPRQGEVPRPKRSALEALRGDFDFSAMPDDDIFQRDRSTTLRPNPFEDEQ